MKKHEKGRLEPLFKSPDGSITYLTDGNFIFAKKDGASIRLDLFAGRYYKLRPVNGVPILEVDGLRMHLVRDFKTPLEYSSEVVRALGIPDAMPPGIKEGFCVLDTCMGLGYTAIAAAKKGSVRLVASCELSEAVISLTRWNPFSDGLWAKEGKITVLQGDSAELIKAFEDSMFSFIIHDPPRLSHAPELYSGSFYSELLRVLEPGGRLFHYVGSVGEKRGRRIDQEAALRLQKAGFAGVAYSAKLQGLLATKPKSAGTIQEIRPLTPHALPPHLKPRSKSE
jgi:predicted methyltransferase